MKTKHFHPTNFGSMGGPWQVDRDGYVEYHASDRYAAATDEQLHQWLRSRLKAVRNAAAAEIANRRLDDWRDRHCR